MGDSNSLNIPNMHDQKPLAIPLLLDDGIPTISTHQSQSGERFQSKRIAINFTAHETFRLPRTSAIIKCVIKCSWDDGTMIFPCLSPPTDGGAKIYYCLCLRMMSAEDFSSFEYSMSIWRNLWLFTERNRIEIRRWYEGGILLSSDSHIDDDSSLFMCVWKSLIFRP